MPSAKCQVLFGEHYRLHAGNLKALAATHVLAGHHVVAAQHVGAGFSKFSAVAVVPAPGQLFFLGSYQPRDLVLACLLAMRAAQVGNLLLLLLVEKIALVHRESRCSSVVGRWPKIATGVIPDYYTS